MNQATMATKENEHAAEIINDLVQINNDRIAGYDRATQEAKDTDADLKMLFQAMKQESIQYKQELSGLVTQYGEEPAEGTRTDGKIYRAWMDVKATFSGNSRKSVLENCEFGEDAAQKAYTNALAEDDLPVDVRNILMTQKVKLKESHDKIRRIRDASQP